MGNNRSRPSRAESPPGQAGTDAEAGVAPAQQPGVDGAAASATAPQAVQTNGQQHLGRWRPAYPRRSQTPTATNPPPAPGPDASGPSQELTRTATIRNAVNLKKQTLKLEPVEGDPQLLSISFSYDASAPCRVTTYVLVSEDLANGCALKPAGAQGATAAAPAAFVPGTPSPAGLGLRFPPAGDAAAARSHAIDLRKVDSAVLLAPPAGATAVVIRLETVSAAGVSEGRTLDSLAPGAAQPAWVQSQTTLVRVTREEGGALVLHATGQKIWADGVSYELQEIFGLEASRLGAPRAEGAADGTAADDEDRLCVICLVNERDTTVLPCRHMCMCHECAQELRRQTSRCPICRNHVESLLHIRIKRSDDAGPTKPAAAAAPTAAA